MGFKLHLTDSGRVPSIEYLPAGAIVPKAGLALTESSGKLAIASGATAPTYICVCEKDDALEAGDVIPVIRVLPDMIFETTASAALSTESAGVNIGDKVTLHTDGLSVTATKTSGVAEIVGMDGTAAGSAVLVRF